MSDLQIFLQNVTVLTGHTSCRHGQTYAPSRDILARSMKTLTCSSTAYCFPLNHYKLHSAKHSFYHLRRTKKCSTVLFRRIVFLTARRLLRYSEFLTDRHISKIISVLSPQKAHSHITVGGGGVGSLVDIATRLWAVKPTNRGSIPGKG